MINIISIIIIFCCVLFFYVHIHYHYKTSNDLEVYELENPSKDKFEEICNIRQPVLLSFNNEMLNDIFNLTNIEQKYGIFDVKIRNKYYDIDDKNNYENLITKIVKEELFIPIQLHDGLKTLDNNCNILENNLEFLQESGLIKYFKYNDTFLKPYGNSYTIYDFIIGSKNVKTRFRYNLSYRTYYYIAEGNIQIKLTQPKNTKYLYENKDYDNFEFNSLINPWNVEEKYINDFSKFKCLDVNLKKGDIIYIPAYWWYSINFKEKSSICKFKYYSYINLLSISPELIISLLQKQNIKHKIVKSITINKENNIVNVPENVEYNFIDDTFNSNLDNKENILPDTSKENILDEQNKKKILDVQHKENILNSLNNKNLTSKIKKNKSLL
tara:strand:- start:1856 stop:3007 length:1152 start_codon:yes stop_codon:yes gene_type:complete